MKKVNSLIIYSIACFLLLIAFSCMDAMTAQPIKGKVRWQRSFTPVTYGDQQAPQNDGKFAGGRGSWNLAFNENHLAVIAADVPNPRESYYLTVLSVENGKTEKSFPIRQDVGTSRSYEYPWSLVSASADNPPGLVKLYWDEASGILFTAQGGYHSAYTAYRPFDENTAAYTNLAQDHPNLQDAFGYTRGDYQTRMGTEYAHPGMEADIWGLSAMRSDRDTLPNGKPLRYDLDWQSIWGRQGSSYYNTSGVFSAQSDGPLIGLVKGSDWGHNQAGHFYLFNKYSGMKVMTEKPVMPANPEGLELRPFTSGGVVFSEDRLYLLGPSEDRDGDKMLGHRRPEGHIPRVDQGLAVWAYDLEMMDQYPNDGAEGPATLDVLKLTPAFAHTFESRYTEDESLESYGQSWYETDGYYRPKATVTDEKGIWVAWKPSREEGIELVYACVEGTRTIDLGIGKGMKGVDIWPKLKMADLSDGDKRLVFATPASQWRERIQPENPEAFLSPFLYGREDKQTWEELPEADKKRNLERVERSGAWSSELSGPRGDAAIAVADPVSGNVLWSDNLSERFPDMPVNGFWTFIDRMQMTVKDGQAIIGWVDTSSEEALLKLVVYNLRGSGKPTPKVKDIPLGFSSEEGKRSVLTDLKEYHGTLFALVTQGKNYHLRDPRWQAQHILAID